MSVPADPRPLGAVFAALSEDLLLLVTHTGAVAGAEARDAARRVTTAALLALAGVAVALVGGFTLISALVLIMIALGLAPWAAALLVGVLLLLGGAVVVQIGITSVRRVPLEFAETRGAVTENWEWLKTLRQ
jgi:hypothetical protein